MEMIFEQVLYGRGPQGYAVLGDSGCTSELMGHVESLCQQHGTPDVDSMSRLQPFLFQHCSCGHVYMGCGRAGGKDDFGRDTLFFHVLIGDAEEVAKAGVSAVDLFRMGLFAAGRSALKLEKVEVKEGALRPRHAVSRCALELPAVVMCKCESNHKMLKLIGDAISKVGWTSCSWNASRSFEIIGMSALRSLDSVPMKFNVYDENGKLVRGRAGQDCFAGNGVDDLADAVASPQVERDAPVVRRDFGWTPLVAAFLVGLVAGVLVCVVFGGSAGDAGAKVVRFDEKSRIERQELQRYLGTFGGDSRKFLLRMEKYYDFVEENFPKIK